MPEKIPTREALLLAEAVLGGDWEIESIATRLRKTCIPKYTWLKQLASRLITTFYKENSRTLDHITQFVLTDSQFLKAYHRDQPSMQLRMLFWPPPIMHPKNDWDVPRWRTTAELANYFQLSQNQLDWFAGLRSHQSRCDNPKLNHYQFRWIKKANGNLRLLEIPKFRLKTIQRRLLDELLGKVPVHESAHGFCPSKSIRTFVAPHTCQKVVWRIDLKDFFTRIHAGRVHALFRTIGYTKHISRALTGLCTIATPQQILAENPVKMDLYRSRHLPQGAPTSPTIANLAAFRLDIRLSALSRKMNIQYTRYADDLAFSGDDELRRSSHHFRQLVLQIILEEGFVPNMCKSRWMMKSQRQQLCGLLVNQKPNINRDEYDRLKAILTNCKRYGPERQNRDGHRDFRAYLAGKIAFVTHIHFERGQKLKSLFDAVVWPD